MKSFMYGMIIGICGLLIFANPRIVSKTWSGVKAISQSSYSLSYDFLKDILVPQLKSTSAEVAQEAKVAQKKIATSSKKVVRTVSHTTKSSYEAIKEKAEDTSNEVKEKIKDFKESKKTVKESRIASQVPKTKIFIISEQ